MEARLLSNFDIERRFSIEDSTQFDSLYGGVECFSDTVVQIRFHKPGHPYLSGKIHTILCPTKHDQQQVNWKVVFDLYNYLQHAFVNILLHTPFMKHIIAKLYDRKIPIVLVFPRCLPCGLPFLCVNITGDIKTSVQISIY